jgi:predicted P-loop ATPase
MTKKYPEYKKTFNLLGYQFRLNTMNDSIECNGKRITDIQIATIESQMFDRGFSSAAAINRNLKRLAGEDVYHPISEWFDSLSWNGQDSFGKLMNHITFKHPQISRQFYWRFLVGSVGKVESRGYEQNVMLVLDGPQGIGKSHLCAWIVPKAVRKYFVTGGMNPGQKDTKVRIISNFLWEVGELQGITKKVDLEALKNVITEEKFTVRPPYGKHDITKPATCSFFGTVNESGAGFLSDVTGNRRFAIVNIQAIDWNYTNIDAEQIWAQVVHAYKNGESGTFTHQEKAEQETINREYDTLSHVEQYLFALFDVDVSTYQDDWMPISEILDVLEMGGLSKSNQRLNQMELAGILQKNGCQKSRSSSVTGCGRATCYNGLMQKQVAKKQNPYTP